MDLDDHVAPPVRRVSRDALEHSHLDDDDDHDDDFDGDEAAPPPIGRLRPLSSTASPLGSYSQPQTASSKRSGFSSARSTISSYQPSPPARTVVLPYPQYNDLVRVPNVIPAPTQKPYPQYTISSTGPSRTPVPIPNRNPHLLVNTRPTLAHDTYAPPLPRKSPLRLHLDSEPSSPEQRSNPRNYSHPFRNPAQPKPPSQPKFAKTSSFRNPPRPLSYRNNPRMLHSLRRWSSLETIDSVQTTQERSRQNSIDESRPRDSFDDTESTHTTNTTNTSASRRQYLSFYDEEAAEAAEAADDDDEDWGLDDFPDTRAPRPSSEEPRPNSSASSSMRSTSTTTQGSSSKKSTAASLLRKLQGKSQSDPLMSPESLAKGKRVPLDQRSQSSSNSATTSSDLAFPAFSQGGSSQNSVLSKDWKSSNFDTSGLTEAELKKCQKKRINPALYAEMKAARKGRFVSPIGGNTFI